MKDMIDSATDKKNIGLLKNLWELRQALDVYCLISANTEAIKKKGAGWKFFHFLRTACVHLIALDICKVFEDEKKSGKAKEYELNSIDGVLMGLDDSKPAVLDFATVSSFVHKYSDARGEDGTLSAVSLTVKDVKTKYEKELKSFKTFRDKCGAHSEFGFGPRDLPSYDVMELLFNFGSDFYRLVSEAFVSVGPYDLNRNRNVRAGFKRVLLEHGLEDVKTEME
jgi:hypothetical protein